ncbi:MAG TPA: hypothetical protein VD905_09535 [Flavobacteriales bacterium]|nr:hypothetical protein [Flavobacteriales bacterium]
MNTKRFVLTFILLCPYFVCRMDHRDIPFWQDMIFAAIAFGIGHAVFPDKPRGNQKKQENKDVIDND